MVDIDRLHDVVQHKVGGRGCGKTYAQIQNVAGFVELEHPYIVVVISYYHDISYILPMMKEVFDEHGLSLSRTGEFEFQSEHAKIRFMTEDTLKERSRGLNFTLIKMRHWD